MMPTPPVGFRAATRRFHIYIADCHPTFESMAEFAVGNLTPQANAELLSFLHHVMSGDYTDNELKELWSDSEADVHIPDPQNLRAILTAIRNAARAHEDQHR